MSRLIGLSILFPFYIDYGSETLNIEREKSNLLSMIMQALCLFVGMKTALELMKTVETEVFNGPKVALTNSFIS
jgi:hypothetical protein